MNINPALMLLIVIVLIAIIGYLIVIYIKKRNESIRRINMLANIDDLTHLYKRKFFDTIFETELERARRHERSLSAAIIEVDNFDDLKEKYGEKFGDLVIQDIGEIFTDNTRIHDICARYGDHSFASLMPESDLPAALHLCKRLKGSIESTKFAMEDSNKVVRITVAIGVVFCNDYFEDEGVTHEDMLEKANEALKNAKQNGGGKVEAYVKS